MRLASVTLIVLGAVLGLGPAGCGKSATQPSAPSTEVRNVGGATEQFGLDLYAKLRTSPGNLFFSPYSLATALAMTSGGARGQTATEMAAVLHVALPPEQLHPAMAGLAESLRSQDGERKSDKAKGPPYRLAIANAVWAQEKYPFLPEFAELCRTKYNALARTLDLAGAPDASRRTINAWAAEQTGGQIREVLPEEALDANTRMVLASAICFKGTWEEPFKPTATRLQPFRLAGGDGVDVPFMFGARECGYAEDAGVQVLSLPYVGDRFALVAVLPRDPNCLPELEAGLNTERLHAWLGQLEQQVVQVSLPKLDFSSGLVLKDTLAALGMPAAFGPKADFSGLTGDQELRLDDVWHHAAITIDEEGTTATAVTGTKLALKSEEPKRPLIFRADRPFLFMIRDGRTGTILFLGRVMDPRSAAGEKGKE